ncbi:glycosyltransferase family 4 protein [Leptothoe sp. PORK10 BA2]|uniref:glycosyltransferase family 4 protein n=1 Tax=Leptothoe sp. PORK10 BA2 TaxID=3110254 RepID=UPI002B21EBC6|nr:glycosyltransferase family 4 protein [Leptothoe sp. PORK10 BA2]MEA5466979.1 glycosyltransferase family 4 protein [Leptothoe sp. PORK10 BA2]
MKWSVVAPYFNQDDVANNNWLSNYTSTKSHSFNLIARPTPVPNWHEKSVRYTTRSEWLGHWEHAALALNSDADGIITLFPQLPAAIGLQKIFKHTNKPVVAWTFNIGNYRVGTLRRLLSKISLNHIDCFVVHSKQEIDIYSEWLNLPRSRFKFVPFPSPDIEVTFEEERESPFIAALGSAHRDFSCLFDVVEQLNLPTVVASSKSVLENFTIPAQVSTPFGISRDDCRKISQQARINIVPLQAKDDVTAAGHVTVIEAMLMGRAVIVTDAYGMSDYVKHGETGWLVPPGSMESMKEAIELLWNDEELRNRLGQNAQSYARQTFSFQGVASSLEKVLDDVTGLATRA